MAKHTEKVNEKHRMRFLITCQKKNFISKENKKELAKLERKKERQKKEGVKRGYSR